MQLYFADVILPMLRQSFATRKSSLYRTGFFFRCEKIYFLAGIISNISCAICDHDTRRCLNLAHKKSPKKFRAVERLAPIFLLTL